MTNYPPHRENEHGHTNVELGFVVNLQTMRDALSKLSRGGRRWWIASDPADAIIEGSIAIGFGDKACVDRLNTITFRLAVLSKNIPWGGIDRILLLLDPTSLELDQPGIYLEDGLTRQDFLEDFDSFYRPLKEALIRRMLSGDSAFPWCDRTNTLTNCQSQEEPDGK